MLETMKHKKKEKYNKEKIIIKGNRIR